MVFVALVVVGGVRACMHAPLPNVPFPLPLMSGVVVISSMRDVAKGV